MSNFLKYTFYAIGTFLLLFSSIIVGANFIRDSGVFEKSSIEVKKQPQHEQSEASKTQNKVVIKDETTKSTAPATTSVVNKAKLVIEVINYTSKTGLAEDVRTMLENQGYSVSAGNKLDNNQGTSKIIIRKKGANTDKISSMLKISVIKEELQPESRFDVTVIIGSDFNP